tara:strand:+ start:55 stop:348 length:294 start_codon:yes stop_codon:yes gene_type:complete
MNNIQRFIKNNNKLSLNSNNLIYNNKSSLNSNFILSKDKNSPLDFIEITKSEYRFVFDELNTELLTEINTMSKINDKIDIQNLKWCGGGVTIIFKYI